MKGIDLGWRWGPEEINGAIFCENIGLCWFEIHLNIKLLLELFAKQNCLYSKARHFVDLSAEFLEKRALFYWAFVNFDHHSWNLLEYNYTRPMIKLWLNVKVIKNCIFIWLTRRSWARSNVYSSAFEALYIFYITNMKKLRWGPKSNLFFLSSDKDNHNTQKNTILITA